jgi:hypothetical protein
VTARDRIVVIVIGALVALGAYYMLALKPRMKEASSLGTKLGQAQQELDQARSDLQTSQAARASFAANYATVARLGKAVPTDDDVPSLVFQLDSTAKASGVDFRSVSVSAQGGTPPSSTTSANAAASTSDQANKKSGSDQKDSSSGSSSSSSGSSSSSSGSTPAAPTQAATASLPPGASVGPAGLSTMPFSFSFEGDFFRLSDFVSRLERYINARRKSVDVRGRLLMVNGISLTAGEKGFPHMKADIAATAYLLPADQGLFNGATPTGPGQSGTQPVSSGGSSAPVAPATVRP